MSGDAGPALPQEEPRGLTHPLEAALYGFMASHVLFTGDETGVFERLASSPSCSATEIAAAAGLQPDVTARFLNACAALGFLVKQSDQFVMPDELRPFLARSGSKNFAGWLEHLRTVTVRSFSYLPDALRTGKPQLDRVLGPQSAATFDALYADPVRVRAFADAMWNLSFDVSREIAPYAPLSRARSLVDVGGGSGAFAIAAVLSHPELHATVLDLPPLAVHCKRMATEFGVEDRVDFLAADFFTDELPSADAFVLGYILSDWSDEKGTALLEKSFSRLESGGSVIVLERLLHDDRPGPASAALMDLCMMVESSGRHRTATSYIEWLQLVGFEGCTVRRSSADKHMIFGFKP